MQCGLYSYTLDNIQIRPRPFQTPAPPLMDAIRLFGDQILPYCR